VDKIVNFVSEWIVKHAVYRERAPLGILFGRGIFYGLRTTAIDVSAVLSKGGNFKLMVLEQNYNNSEAFSN